MVMPLVIGMVVVIAILLAFVAMQPTEFRIARTTSIAAPPETVFGLVNDFQRWEGWSPWARLDPAMTLNYTGTQGQVGATYAWCGNKKVGEGRMTLVTSQSPRLIQIKLEFLKPFQCTNDTEFTFEPRGGQTDVVWNMTGRNNFMGKLFGLLMNMDKMVGRDFEKGLASLKSLAEAA